MAESKIRTHLYEGFVIVASILVAFALDARWADVQERRVEQRLLGELLAEFQAAESRIESSLTELEMVVRASGELLGYLGPGAPALPAETLQGIAGRLMALNTLEVPSSTLDSIIAGGQLSLIENDALRKRQIAEVYRVYQQRLQANNAFDFDDLIVKTVELFQLFDDVRENHEWHREETDAFLVPALARYAALRNVDYGFPEGFLTPSRFELDASGLQQDPVFEGRLINRLSRQGATMNESEVLLEATRELIALIEAETG